MQNTLIPLQPVERDTIPRIFFGGIDRYHRAEQLYLEEVDPIARADVVVDNRDFARPTARWRGDLAERRD
jgi:hypothetical protein